MSFIKDGGKPHKTKQQKKKHILNNLPDGEQSKQRYLDNDEDYCYKCRFHLETGNNSATCKWKEKGHKIK